MLSGFNTNIRHRGVVFHVQTEDSGLANPHVISHLFHGGNIMASVKREYRSELDSDQLEDVVRSLMETQHKSMLKQLRAGQHDEAILARCGDDIFADPSDTAATLPPESPTQPGDGPTPSGSPIPSNDPVDEKPLARTFGQDVVSDKPLDEVVLDYLVQNARKRKHRAK